MKIKMLMLFVLVPVLGLLIAAVFEINSLKTNYNDDDGKIFKKYPHVHALFNTTTTLGASDDLPVFLFYTVLYHTIEDLFFVNSTEYFNFSRPENPLTRFLPDDHYCFKNFLFVLYYDPLFNQTNIGFDYTLTNETKEYLSDTFGGNYWPSPYKKRKIKSEEQRKLELGKKYNFDSEYNKYIKPIYNLDHKIKSFWTSTYWQEQHVSGKEFSCIFQSSNHLPGNKFISHKDQFVRSHRKYNEIYKSRSHCFKNDSLVPRSFLLYERSECEEFFRIINEDNYRETVKQKGPIYIRKVGAGSHRGRGVEVVDAKEEETLKEAYNNGIKCGIETKNYIIQEYITNPLLVNGHKFDFRVYLYIISVDPLIVYFHDGFLKVSLYTYDPFSTEKASHITSTELSKEIFKRVENGDTSFNKTSNELKEDQLWSFQRFHKYLMDQGKIDDPNWIENFLRPTFRKAMVHLSQMNYKFFSKNPTFREMFGVDFIFDEDFNLWLLEVNSNPELMPTNEYKEIFFHTLLKENLELSLAYLKSKATKIITYIFQLKKKILQDVDPHSKDISKILKIIESRMNATQVRDEIQKLSKNNLDAKLFPANNSHQLVLDYSRASVGNVFNGNLAEDCILDFNDFS